MVKITEQKDLIRKVQRKNKLVDIANRTLPDCRVDGFISPNHFPVIVQSEEGKSVFHVYPGDNTMVIEGQIALNSAAQLGRAYEASGEPEFTLHKAY